MFYRKNILGKSNVIELHHKYITNTRQAKRQRDHFFICMIEMERIIRATN